MTLIGYGLPALLILVAAWIGFTFNRFSRLRNMTREAWGGVEVQLKRRHDLIPLLAASVKASGTTRPRFWKPSPVCAPPARARTT